MRFYPIIGPCGGIPGGILGGIPGIPGGGPCIPATIGPCGDIPGIPGGPCGGIPGIPCGPCIWGGACIGGIIGGMAAN